MKQKTVFDLALGALVVFLLYIGYMMFAPFLPALFWAIVFSLAFYPVYLFALRKTRREGLSAVIVILLSFFVIVGPLSYISYLLVLDIKGIIGRLGADGVLKKESLAEVVGQVSATFHIRSEEIYSAINQAAENLKTGIVHIINARFFTVVHAVVDYFIMLFTMFFLLKDGHIFTENLTRYLPLSPGKKDRMIRRTKEVIIATLYGGVLIGIIHGVIGGLSFYIMGIPSPVLLGFLMFLFSFIPVVGTFAVWGPASAYLFLSGRTPQGIAMACIGLIVLVGVIDHFVKPMILGGRAKIHILLIFFGVIGGMHLFGIIGFIAGPLIVALLILSLEMVNAEIEDRKEETQEERIET